MLNGIIQDRLYNHGGNVARLKINGYTPLIGKVSISGAKNEALKVVPLSIIINGKIEISNVPDILDVANQTKILKSTGADVSYGVKTITVDTSAVSKSDITLTCAGKLRASIVFAGPLLARFSHVTLPYPGGCLIGARSIETHLDAFKQVGAKIVENKNVFSISIKQQKDSIVNLNEKSVTGTENIIMYAAGIEATTLITNCAIEPEITHLASNLEKAGCKISGIGTRELRIRGSKKLRLEKYEIMPDRIEAGTFMAAFVATSGEGEIYPYPANDLETFTRAVESTGAMIRIENNRAIIKKQPRGLKPFAIETAPYPGFPTDLQSPMSLLAARAKGVSLIRENMFENRLFYLKELEKMGLRVNLLDKQVAEISGPATFKPTTIESLDLRSGITLLVAAIMTEGETVIKNAEIIDRGYEDIETKLKNLGAKIERFAE